MRTLGSTHSRGDGDDRIGTFMRVVAAKHERGWIVIDRDSVTRCPYSPLPHGQKYCAWAMAVAAARKKRHAAHEAKEAEAFMSRKRAEAEMIATLTAAANRESMHDLGREVGTAVAKALGHQTPPAADAAGKKARSERAE